MRKLKGIKWYWFIPIIGIFFLKQQVEWINYGQTENARIIRYYIVNIGLLFLQIFSYLPLVLYGFNLLK